MWSAHRPFNKFLRFPCHWWRTCLPTLLTGSWWLIVWTWWVVSTDRRRSADKGLIDLWWIWMKARCSPRGRNSNQVSFIIFIIFSPHFQVLIFQFPSFQWRTARPGFTLYLTTSYLIITLSSQHSTPAGSHFFISSQCSLYSRTWSLHHHLLFIRFDACRTICSKRIPPKTAAGTGQFQRNPKHTNILQVKCGINYDNPLHPMQVISHYHDTSMFIIELFKLFLLCVCHINRHLKVEANQTWVYIWFCF